MRCGLLGQVLGHSYSPQLHAMLGSYSYRLFEIAPEDLERFMTSGEFDGLNVTIPYKKAVIPYCDELTPQAQRLGAVNTVVRNANGKLIGHNTDHFGFQSTVARTGLDYTGKKVLVLGSGGAGNTVCAVMQELGAQVITVSRKGENNYGNLNRHRDCFAIVNATPVGMYPHTGTAPVDLRLFPELQCVIDLIYNPARTQLLLDAQDLGIQKQNGLWMLSAQAKESAQWFTGRRISDSVIATLYKNLKHTQENIVLIGMPGCGKSTVGRLLAEMAGLHFVDSDDEICARSGCSIPNIFAKQGEGGFRKLESQVLAELCSRHGQIIATGGGCVTVLENSPILRQNATVIWLKRSLAELPTDGRPLSQSTPLSEMYEKRMPLYDQLSDHAVDNSGTPEDTARQICKLLNWEDR